MKNRKFLIQAGFIFLLLLGYLNAQNFNASVSSSSVEQFEHFQVDFTFNSNDMNGIENFQPPSLNSFKILSGPNQSTSMQIINNSVSSSVTFSYIIVAENTGQFTIGVATIKFKGKTYQSKPITVTITKGNPNKKKNTQSGSQEVSSAEIDKNVFIRAISDKNRASIGEQVTVTYKLYTRLNISTPQVQKLPQYQGFWAEELQLGNVIRLEPEMYQGQRYNAATLKKVALFPTKAGSLDVTPFELVIPVQIKKKGRSSDPFDEFFNDSFFGRVQTVEHMARSNKIKIDVSGLPDQNAPASFTGLVGNYKILAEISKTQTKVNDAISLKYIVTGTGNIKLLNIPDLKIPSGFEKYEPKITENISNAGVVSGKKVIEYLLVPRTQGKKTIPAIEFSFFNPSTRRYETQKTTEYVINVLPGDGTTAQIPEGFTKEDIQMLNQDIRYIKTEDYSFTKTGEFSVVKSWFIWIVAILLLAFGGFILFTERKRKLSGDVQLMKFRKAEKLARTKLKKASEALLQNNKEVYFAELSQALTGYIENKLRIDRVEFTVDRVAEELSKKGIDEEYINILRTIYEKCEIARFAPGSYTQEANQQILDDAVKLIIHIDSFFKK